MTFFCFIEFATGCGSQAASGARTRCRTARRHSTIPAKPPMRIAQAAPICSLGSVRDLGRPVCSATAQGRPRCPQSRSNRRRRMPPQPRRPSDPNLRASPRSLPPLLLPTKATATAIATLWMPAVASMGAVAGSASASAEALRRQPAIASARRPYRTHPAAASATAAVGPPTVEIASSRSRCSRHHRHCWPPQTRGAERTHSCCDRQWVAGQTSIAHANESRRLARHVQRQHPMRQAHTEERTKRRSGCDRNASRT